MKTFQEFKTASATSPAAVKMVAKFYAATTATSAASPSSNQTVNVGSFGVATSCAVRARKRKKFTLADEQIRFAFSLDTSRTQLLLTLKILFQSLSLSNLQFFCFALFGTQSSC